MDRIKYLRDGVRRAYSEVAENPQAEHPFPVGRQFAESLGYPLDVLTDLPPVVIDAFAGVSNVAIFADIPPGVTVLDLGCGAGLDSLLAIRRAGPTGRVIGIDFSETMLGRARQAAAQIGINNVEFHQADAEELPFDDASFDIALINGIFNLNPVRDHIFRELGRVVRPNGAVYAAELILREPLPPEMQTSDTDWFA